MSKPVLNPQIDWETFERFERSFGRNVDASVGRLLLQIWAIWRAKLIEAWNEMRRDGGAFRGKHQWDALKATTRPENETAIINRDSGQAFREVTRANPTSSEAGRALTIGDTAPEYAAYAFDKGGRDPFQWDPEDDAAAGEVMEHWMLEVVAKSGGGIGFRTGRREVAQ